MSVPNSLIIPSPHPSPLATVSLFSKSVSLFCKQARLYHVFLDSTYEGCCMMFLLLCLSCLILTLSGSIHVVANSIFDGGSASWSYELLFAELGTRLLRPRGLFPSPTRAGVCHAYINFASLPNRQNAECGSRRGEAINFSTFNVKSFSFKLSKNKLFQICRKVPENATHNNWPTIDVKQILSFCHIGLSSFSFKRLIIIN